MPDEMIVPPDSATSTPKTTPTSFTVTSPFTVEFVGQDGVTAIQQWSIQDGARVKLADIKFGDESVKEALMQGGFGTSGSDAIPVRIILQRE